MKRRNQARRMVALLLILSALFVCNPQVLAAEIKNEQQVAYDALPDDAIVCFMYGQPVYKYEVDEYGVVHKNFNSGISTMATGTGYTIPTSHRGYIIWAGCTLVTSGFSQTENIAYLPVDEAVSVADSFETAATVASAVSVFSKVCIKSSIASGMIKVFSKFLKSALQGISEDMYEYLNSGSRVQLCVTTSSYGQFCAVNSWNGTSCVRDGFADGSTTYTVNSVICDHCGSSVWG